MVIGAGALVQVTVTCTDIAPSVSVLVSIGRLLGDEVVTVDTTVEVDVLVTVEVEMVVTVEVTVTGRDISSLLSKTRLHPV